MSYFEWIKKNGLYKSWCEYRLHHLKISKNRALRAFCLRHGYEIAKYRRQHEASLNNVIKIAKTSWLDKELPL